VVEHEGFGGACRLPVVMRRNSMEELGGDIGRQCCGARLDQTEAEVDVAEESSLLGLAEGRATAELDRTSNVVEQRCREEKIVAQARMELGGLATQSGDADRVLEEAAGVAVVPVRSGGG